ncbi:Zinc transport protein ZntB [Pseudovibrio sp. W64]|uniref:CorA family divalent cation transporter n=1 Tax=unclassified Pseudovibrio TaxID=2627060 RepID=UPI0007AEC4A9|nr:MULTISPECIES: CorA family divalent cation transporter [unclassified Pseudovibrio]KZK87003.1 Zinc transport protein ZntB [Pseudovibrio sp. Ad13]KZK87873.1 Zinc transport protein ZntB [Pseudovibrio sp. W64]KZK95877.1 Zinc transport protein ZntB [Pseudovibrio sp. Ad46]KZL00800.1 Zinc transport protein ZntB [Pseudovibrio sp. Ad5]
MAQTTENIEASHIHLDSSFVIVFSKSKGMRRLTLEQLRDYELEPDEFYWAYLQRIAAQNREFLEEVGLEHSDIDDLLAREVRPHCHVRTRGAFIAINVFNELPKQESGDMECAQIWVDAKRMICIWHDPLDVFQSLLEGFKTRVPPESTAEFWARLVLAIAERAEEMVEVLQDRIDHLEDVVLETGDHPWESELAQVRRLATIVRRSMLAHLDILRNFEIEKFEWVNRINKRRVREAGDRALRIAEEMDAIRERAEIVHDQIMFKRSENTNRYMLMMAAIAVVFLPLSFVTGLLGINVGGIPGSHDPVAFSIVSGLLIIFGVGLFAIVRWFRIF